jgi:hypothetical protein
LRDDVLLTSWPCRAFLEIGALGPDPGPDQLAQVSAGFRTADLPGFEGAPGGRSTTRHPETYTFLVTIIPQPHTPSRPEQGTVLTGAVGDAAARAAPERVIRHPRVRVQLPARPLNVGRTRRFGWLELVCANEIEIAERGP